MSSAHAFDVRGRWFTRCAGAILAGTAIGKVTAALGGSGFLGVSDPIMGLPFGWLLLAVGLLEVGVASLCFFGRDTWRAIVLVAWLATCFLVYRVALWLVGWTRPCGCLGSLTTVLEIPEAVADQIVVALLGFLLIGSYVLLLWHWLRPRHQFVHQGEGMA